MSSTLSQQQTYQTAGFGRSLPRGSRPAIVVVDFSYGFTDLQYPTACDARSQMACSKALCDALRAKGWPIFFSTIAYEPGELHLLPWLKKASGMTALLAGSRLVEIDAATGIQPQDVVICKKGASSFFASPLAALLSSARIDTLIVVGATTSGCVRATVVDAVQSGFLVLVASDGCADRASAPHEANLYDMQQKYADVTDSQELLSWMAGLPPRSDGLHAS
jgi:maleamate amidohydrolase